MTDSIRLAISTCPNDTFAFHALINRLVDWQGLRFDIQLLDIAQLNQGLFEGKFDVAKASFHAALHLTEETVVLPSGSALGFGVGPLLLSTRPDMTPTDRTQTTLCPGKHTTATMLFKLFYPQTTVIKHTVFSDIMPLVGAGEADFGVCIHEGRFTWQTENLGLVEDLGSRWETTTESPLPLGGILARRSLTETTIATVQSVIKTSLQYALDTPDDALPTMRKYAQEFNDDVLMKHVELYVNDWTLDLGDIGARSLSELHRQAVSCGLVSSKTNPIEVFDS